MLHPPDLQLTGVALARIGSFHGDAIVLDLLKLAAWLEVCSANSSLADKQPSMASKSMSMKRHEIAKIFGALCEKFCKKKTLRRRANNS